MRLNETERDVIAEVLRNAYRYYDNPDNMEMLGVGRVNPANIRSWVTLVDVAHVDFEADYGIDVEKLDMKLAAMTDGERAQLLLSFPLHHW